MSGDLSSRNISSSDTGTSLLHSTWSANLERIPLTDPAPTRNDTEHTTSAPASCRHSIIQSGSEDERDTTATLLPDSLGESLLSALWYSDSALARADALLESGDMEGAYAAYHHAADLGSPPAMFYVAMMHHQGMGVSRDDIKAISLLSRAADAGSEDAQFYLARTYESSSYPTDESQIVKLYADAASNGFLAAYYYLSKYEDHPERYVRRTHMRR